MSFPGKSVAYTLVGAFILLWIAIVNGQPFFFPDTSNYIRAPDAAVTILFGQKHATSWTRQAGEESKQKTRSTNSLDEGFVISGRSPYYGGILYLGELVGGVIFAAAAQAVILSYALFVLIVRCFGFSPRVFLLSVVGLTLFSSASYYVALLMPDIFAGIAILIAGTLLAFWDKLNRFERTILSALLAFAILTHSSIPLVITVVLGAVVVAGLIIGRRSFVAARFYPIAAVLCCIVSGVLGELAFNLVVSSALGHSPVRPPFLTARLIDMGPGYQFLKSDCEKQQFVVCKFRDSLPQMTDAFMWSQVPGEGVFSLSDTDTKRKLGDEQYRFLLSVVKFDPVGVFTSYVRGGLTQLVTFGLDEFRFCADCDYEGKLPEKYLSKMREAVAFRYHQLVDFSEVAQLAVVIGCALYLMVLGALWAAGRRSVTTSSSIDLFYYAVVIGILANALVCGSFSTLHDRYQARVIWLVPLLAFLAFAIRQAQAPTMFTRAGAVEQRVS